ncbi:MAG: hypothetical protein Q6351_006965 [Candidatus Njordarchaeum guaymaensis]
MKKKKWSYDIKIVSYLRPDARPDELFRNEIVFIIEVGSTNTRLTLDLKNFKAKFMGKTSELEELKRYYRAIFNYRLSGERIKHVFLIPKKLIKEWILK